MEADGPEGIAEIILTPCIFRKEEKARIAAAVMTVGYHPAVEPYHIYSPYIYYLDTLLKDNSHHLAISDHQQSRAGDMRMAHGRSPGHLVWPLIFKFEIFACR